LAFASPAQAGTIELKRGVGRDASDYYVFTAGAGERNHIVAERVAGGFRLRDSAGAPTGCPADGPDAVRCPRDTHLRIDAGDGDDVILVDSGLTSADGGPGNDRLTATGVLFGHLYGGDGDDVLEGGPGDDDLDGGPGADRVSGGAGRDTLMAGLDGPVPSPDHLDGGDGPDRVEYGGRTLPVRVDLLRPDEAGSAGERDVMRGIENVSGGNAPDILLGDDGPNEIDPGDPTRGRERLDGRGGDDIVLGGAGDDTVAGGAGDDHISGNGGDDRYDGGPGDDRIFVDRERGAPVRCGAGRDLAFINATGGARLASDCEHVDAEGPLVRIRSHTLALRWDVRDYRRPCRMRVTFTRDGRVLGRLMLRRFTRIVRLPARPVRVSLRPSSRCDGPLGRGYVPKAFRLV
jgi:Ca2+-binding RTX toxin-like protein